MPRRFVIRRVGWLTQWCLGLFLLAPMVGWGVWFNVWRETVACQHGPEGEVRCTFTGNGPGGDGGAVVTKGALRVETETTVSRTRSGTTTTSHLPVLVTASGPLRLPIPLFTTLAPHSQRELVEQLDTFVRLPEAPPLTRTLTPGLPLRALVSMLGALGLLGFYSLGWNTQLEIADRQLVIRRRTYGLVRDRIDLPLDSVTGVEPGRRLRQRVEMLLNRQGGGPIELGPVNWNLFESQLAAVRRFLGR